ncbi:MAG: hypothetical protein ACQERL_11400, partial [Bacillota bacterium]
MLKKNIINTKSKNNLYRRILLIVASFYLIYYLVYIFLSVDDPMFFSLRFSTILLYLAIYFFSYKFEWINTNIEKITQIILTISVLQLLYFNHIFDFKFRTAGFIIIAVLMFNLI